MSAAARTLSRYVGREILLAVAFVLVGFLGLFAFFDLLAELRLLGRGDYQLRQMFLFVALSAPTHAYELMPVAVLIGTMYVLAHLANNSEFTVMRAAGMSPQQASAMLLRVGLAFAAATFAIGEWVAPAAEEAAQQVRLRAMSGSIGQSLRSGLWFKDERAFINVREARVAEQLEGVRVYEFDADYRLERLTIAARGAYLEPGAWRLSDVARTRFTADAGARVYVVRSGSIAAFILGTESPDERGFHLVGAHTDSPNLRVKPTPDLRAAGCLQLAVEPYGGVLQHTWLDRDLGLAGRVHVQGNHGLEQRLGKSGR